MSRVLVALSLFACGESPDLFAVEAPAPPTQSLNLSSTALVPGSPVTITVTGLGANEVVYIGRGRSLGNGMCIPSAGGACLGITNPVQLLGTYTANANGVASTTFMLPRSVPAGLDVGMQALAFRGPGGSNSALSNPLLVTTGGGSAGYCYDEPGNPDADVSDIQSTYYLNWLDRGIDLFERRWPSGATLLEDRRYDTQLYQFMNTQSFGTFVDSLAVIIHEGTHGYDYENALFYQYMGFFVRTDYSPQIDFHQGFNRSEIYHQVDPSTALYRDTYLQGTQGARGLMELLDEYNCYINDLASMAVTGEFMPFQVSGRDAPLAFAHYLMVYLERARTTDPVFYAELQADTDLHDFLITQWLRMYYFLEISDAHPGLGFNDAQIEAVMLTQKGELEMLTGVQLDDSSCLPSGETWQPPY